MKVRKEIGDAVDVRQRDLRPARESLQLIGRQIAVLALNLPQVVEDQTVIISAESPDYCTEGSAIEYRERKRCVWLVC